jgi:DNA polymerase-3 subunit gamma/tau
MDHFIVSARKYRPATFDTVVGQQHITGTLKNAIKNNQLAQAFLFCGPRGVGKTTCARILAKTINCQNTSSESEACGVCPSCTSSQNGNSFNVHELDAASNNSVDDIRSLIEQVRIPPQVDKYKIYIVDEVHMLSQAAFNAFLKTLEEPPSYAIFILATTEKHKILPTILSRCQIFDFNRIRVDDIADHLTIIAKKEGIDFDRDGLHLIAQKADGGLRDALSMFDQIVSFSNKNVSYKAVAHNLNILDHDFYFKITEALLAEDIAQALLIFHKILEHGFDGNHFIIGLASHLRDLLVCKDEITLALLEVSDGIRLKYQQQSQETTTSFLLSALNIANQCDLNYKASKNQRLQVELSLIKMCHISAAFNLSVSQAPVVLEKKNTEQSLVNPTTLPKRKRSEPIQPPLSIDITEQQNEPPVQETLGPMAKYSPDDEALKTAEILIDKQHKPTNIKKPSLIIGATNLIPNLNTLATATLVEEQKPSYIIGTSQQPFTTDDLIKLWTNYANRKKLEGKINLFTLMTSRPPVLLDNAQIELCIENSIQEAQLLDEKIDLLNFLRTTLQNFNIDIVTKLVEDTHKKRLYTSTEKYQYMTKKNPKLEAFKQRFNLGIDF